MKKNKEIASIFNQIADALEYKGENVFRVVAYRKAARILEELTEDVEELLKTDKLKDLPGIGEGMAKKIEEYLKTGKMQKYIEATKGIPPTLLELLNIQNLGPKTLALANKHLGVKNLQDLKKVIEDGSLAKLPQMGEKKVENIKKGIELYERSHERLSIAVAASIASGVIEYLKNNAPVSQISPAGSLRRWKETIGDIDILVTGKDHKKIVEVFTHYPEAEQVISAGETKSSILVQGGVQVDIRIVDKKSYGAALQYFTGSKAHNVKLRGIAVDKKWKLNEYGLFEGERVIAGENEEGVYKKLGLQWIPPELREDRGEVELALKNELPRLLELSDIKGDLQMHSTYSDSSATIEELALTAQKLGYEYILITDHSRSAKYAHGLEIERLFKQWEEIDELNKKFKNFKILKGIEVDILPNGKLDYPDKILKELDFVVASIHQGFTKNVTERICSAMENPYIDIIGHPTGRLISKREGYAIDIEKVIKKAIETRTILECNAYPDRLDLNDVNLKRCKELGVKISIGTDAHSVEELKWMKFGVATCRRGWLEKDDVVNTYPLDRLLKLRKINQK
uniref:DNA polymerase beta n=1 Tax=candidate division WOR-3 bacterium TaxID=2052148 RepID=A0A7C6AFH3_UNCW3